MFCIRCGSPMRQVENNNVDTSSILLFIWIIFYFVANLTIVLIQKSNANWYEDSTKMVIFLIYIAQDISYLLPAFAIKYKPIKILAIIVTFIMVTWWIIQNIQWIKSLPS